MVAEQRQPAGVFDHEVETVAMSNEVALAVGRDMNGIGHYLDAAEMGAEIIPQELVMVAGNVDEPCALARLAQQFLDHVVMGLRPVPAGLQLPAVDDVADEIDGIGLQVAQEGEKPLCLARLGPQMYVRNENGAIWSGLCLLHVVTIACSQKYKLGGTLSDSCVISMTPLSQSCRFPGGKIAGQFAARGSSAKAVRMPSRRIGRWRLSQGGGDCLSGCGAWRRRSAPVSGGIGSGLPSALRSSAYRSMY